MTVRLVGQDRPEHTDRGDRGDRGDAAEASQRLLPCAFCAEPTPHSTLAALGARCSPCYASFCSAQPPAAALRPTQFQRDVQRAAMRYHAPTEDLA